MEPLLDRMTRPVRRAVAAALGLAVLAAGVLLVVTEHRTVVDADPSTWPGRGPLHADARVLAAALAAWRREGTIEDGPPTPFGGARLLWAGPSPADPSRRLAIVLSRARGGSYDGTPQFVGVADERAPGQWQLSGLALARLLAPAAIFFPASCDQCTVVFASPGTEHALQRAAPVDEVAPQFVEHPLREGLAGPWPPAPRPSLDSSAGTALRTRGVAGTQTTTVDFGRRVSLRFVPARPSWPPLGPPVPPAELAVDAGWRQQLVGGRSASAVSLWSGRLLDGRPAHVVESAVHSGPTYVGLSVGGVLLSRVRVLTGLRGCDVVGLQSAAGLLVLARPGVRRLVVRDGARVLADVQGRVVQVPRPAAGDTVTAYAGPGPGAPVTVERLLGATSRP